MTRCLAARWAVLCLFPLAARAAELDVRVIAASTAGQQVDASLRDIEPLLRRHLNFTSFELVKRGTIRLPSEGRPLALGDVAIRCLGGQERLAITIEQSGRVVVQTQTSLRHRHPLVFSGLPGPRGTLLIALLLR